MGATLMRRALKMSGSKAVSEEPVPAIRRNPTTTIAMPTANRMKFVLSNAKFFLSIYLRYDLDFIQISRCHPQEAVDRYPLTYCRDNDAEEQHRDTCYSQFPPSDNRHDMGFKTVKAINAET